MSNFSNAGSGMKVGDIKRLSDISIPDSFFDRVRTGIEQFDALFGGNDLPGIMPSSSILITGTPGAGKSTLTLQLADKWASSGMKLLYNIGEENEYAVKYRASRLNLSGNFELSKFDNVGELCSYVANSGIKILVQDSIQTLDDENISSSKALKHAVEQLVTLSKDCGVTVFMIGHVTKTGIVAGPQKLVHDVDVHVHLSLMKDDKRLLEIKKSRIGPSNVSCEISMDENGIQFTSCTSDKNDNDLENNAEDYIKSMLMQGKKLSGYSYLEDPMLSELGVNGGKMRTLLEKVAIALSKLGHKIVREKINRREHVFIDANNE